MLTMKTRQQAHTMQTMQQSLRQDWDPAKYKEESAPELPGQVVEPASGVDRHRVDAYVPSLTRIMFCKVFAAFVDVLVLRKFVPRALLKRFEGCRSCPDDEEAQAHRELHGHGPVLHKFLLGHCPMAGKCVAYLAAGEHLTYFGQTAASMENNSSWLVRA